MPLFASFFQVLQLIKITAEIVNEFSEAATRGTVNQKLDEALKRLQSLENAVIAMGKAITEEIRRIAKHIDENEIKNRITLANTAFHVNLLDFQRNNNQASRALALQNSFMAANRLVQEDELHFLGGLLHTVNLRLAVIKTLEPCFYQYSPYVNEINGYILRLSAMVDAINQSIQQLHTVETERTVTDPPSSRRPGTVEWIAMHKRGGVIIWADAIEYTGRSTQTPPPGFDQVVADANQSRLTGIEQERSQIGVDTLEVILSTWRNILQSSIAECVGKRIAGRELNFFERQALTTPTSSLLLGDVSHAALRSPQITAHDGEATPQKIAVNLLLASDMRSQINGGTNAVGAGDAPGDVGVLYRRIFDKEIESTQEQVLQEVVKLFGYESFINCLVYSKEFHDRYGVGSRTDDEL